MTVGGIDFAAINSAALRNGRSLVQDLIPGGKFRSLEYVVKNPCRNDERPGSFTINYRDGVERLCDGRRRLGFHFAGRLCERPHPRRSRA